MLPGTLSAGVVVVRRLPGGPHYLLLRAYGYWDFPKGALEAGETPLTAAIREVKEESGLDDLVFHWGETFRETAPYGPKRKVARYYLAESPAAEACLPISEELGRPEHDEFRWLSYAAARHLLGPRVRRVLDWAHALVEGDDARA